MSVEAAAGGAAPYYASPSGDVVLHRGDAAAVLRALPAGSVHASITSVPYYALRSYNTEPQVWGGEATCDHEWGAVGVLDARGAQIGEAAMVDARGAGRGDWCAKCGAWRGELGLEPTPAMYVEHIVAVFREVKRVLHPSGCLWLNCGDSYAAHGRMVTDAPPHKDLAAASARYKNGPSVGRVAGFPRKGLMMMPSRVAIALQDDGWLLRAMIPWLKRSAMPESATDRPTTATEYVFLLSKASSYFYDADATRIRTGNELSWEEHEARTGLGKGDWGGEFVGGVQAKHAGSDKHDGGRSHPAGRNRRNADWWFDSLRAILAGATGLLTDEDGEPLALPVNPAAYPGAHFATFAPRLVEPMLLASTSARGCCPACGAPWTRMTEASYTPHPAGGHVGFAARGDADGMKDLSAMPRLTKHVETTGWRAGCACAEAGDPIPAVVLDPFAGACTTGLVARKHGRRFIGVDLSAAYLAMARERLGQLALPGWSGTAAGGCGDAAQTR